MLRGTRYKRLPLNVAGGTSETRSRSVSVARLANWYPEATPEGVSGAALMPFPGVTSVGFINDYDIDYNDRGAHTFNGVPYFIKGSHLYRLNEDTTCTRIGVIAGYDRCSMASNGGVMVICNGLTPYSYDGTTLSLLSSITFRPSIVTYIGTYFVFDSDSDAFWVSDSFSTNISGDNTAISESSPDSFTAPYAFGQILYLYGEDTIEPWQLATGAPPFERATQAIIERIGCSAPHGITNTVDAMYFIHRSGNPYRVRGFNADAFAPSGIVAQVSRYDLTNYTAKSFSFDGQHFVVFDFPSDNATLCYSETTNTWIVLDSGTHQDQWQAGSYCYAYGKHLLADKTLANIYRLDLDSFVNNWGVVVREKTFEFVSGEKMGDVRGVYEMSRLVIGLEAGVGLISGQGENPLLGVQFSTDGKTWNQEVFVELGRLGDFGRKVEVPYMLQFQQLAIRIRLYDPVGFAIFSAGLDVREAGY